MSNYVHLNSPDFFQQFYNKCIPKNGPVEDCLLSRDTFSGIGVESKSVNIFFRLLRWLNPFVSFDFEHNLAHLRKVIDIKSQLFNTVVKSANFEEKQALVAEHLAMAKTCHFVQHLLKHVVKKRAGSFSLHTAKDFYKAERLAAIDRAAKLLQKDRVDLALEHGFVKEAVSIVTTNGELERLRDYFPQLLKTAYKQKKYSFVMRLIALGADHAILGEPVEKLFQLAIVTKHEGGVLKLMQAFSQQEVLLPIFQRVLEEKIAENSPQARSMLEAGRICLFFSQLLSKLSQKFERLQMYCQEQPLILLKKAADILQKSPFLVAIENRFIDQAHDLEPTQNELLAARIHFPELLKGAYSRGNFTLALDLIDLGADASMLDKALEQLLPLALQQGRFEASFKLVENVSDLQHLLKILRAHVEKRVPKKIEEFHLLERVLERFIQIRRESVPQFDKFLSEIRKALLDLIAEGAPVSSLTTTKEALISRAVYLQHEGALLALVKQGANIHMRYTSNRGTVDLGTLLHIACHKRFHKLVELLLQKKMDVNEQNTRLMTPMHFAAQAGDVRMVRLLLNHGADPSKKDQNGSTALSLVNLRRGMGLAESDQFYKALFEEYSSLEAKNVVQEARRKKKNPFEVPFYLQDLLLAKTMASFYSKHEFAYCLEELEKKFPQADLSLIEYCPYELTNEHFSRGVYSTNVEVPKKDVPLINLLRYCHQKYVPSIKKIIQMVNTKEVYLGTPRKDPALTEFYQIVCYCLQNLIIRLEELEEDPNLPTICNEIFEQLHRASTLCGAQLRAVPTLLYLKYCKGIVLQGDELFYQSLAEYRGLLLEGLFENDPQGVHSWDHFVVSRGEKLGIPGYHIVRSVADEFLGDRDDVQAIEDELMVNYTPQNIVENCIMPKILDGELRDPFVDWHKNHLPEHWQKARFDALLQKAKSLSPEELEPFLKEEVGYMKGDSPEAAIQREKVASYLGTWVYNSDTGELKRRACSDLLLGLNIFKASFQKDDLPQENFLHWLTITVPGGFFSRLASFFKV